MYTGAHRKSYLCGDLDGVRPEGRGAAPDKNCFWLWRRVFGGFFETQMKVEGRHGVSRGRGGGGCFGEGRVADLLPIRGGSYGRGGTYVACHRLRREHVFLVSGIAGVSIPQNHSGTRHNTISLLEACNSYAYFMDDPRD
jgi:hypothetical protein